MSTQTINRGTETAYPTVSNMNSLANDAAKPIGVVDDSATKAEDYNVHLEITLETSGVGATGYVEILLLESTESTSADFTDGIDPTTTSDVATSIKNATLLRVLNANANSQVIKAQFSLLSDLAGKVKVNPKYHSLLIVNKTGAAFAASGHEITYTAIKHDIA